MASELPAVAATILQLLLDRFEQPARQTVVRVRLDATLLPAYFSDQAVAPRRDANALLQQFADRGWLRLHWEKYEQGNWLQAVDLVPAAAAELYQLLGRTPLRNQVDMLEDLLVFQTAYANWHAAFLAWARAHLRPQGSRHRSVAPLALDDLRWNRDLLRALAAIAQLRAPTLERTLSVRLFGNSKRLAELRHAVVQVLRQHDADAGRYADDPAALLRAHHLDRVPEYVPLSGPLTLQTVANTVEIGDFVPSVALPATLLRSATVLACGASAVVTIENATSFSEYVVVRPPTVLVVYTGGFASPTVIELLRNIRAAVPTIPFSHWGDLDAGGLRILAHLRNQLGVVAPVGMDPATFDAYQQHAQPLTKNDRDGLAKLRALPELADCIPLIDQLLTAGRKLEQEAVSIDGIMTLPSL